VIVAFLYILALLGVLLLAAAALGTIKHFLKPKP
jgi:hypothetical protein